MRELLRKIDTEYGFRLTQEEMDRILKEVSEAEMVLKQIDEIDVTAKTPFLRLDVKGIKK
jgi:hypothetical protein